MATTINVTSGDGDGGLLRRDREARDAQRYRDLVQRRDARVRGRAEAAQQQPEQVAQYGRSAPAVRRAGLRPAAHRFGGKYGALQLVIRAARSSETTVRDTGRVNGDSLSLLYAERLNRPVTEFVLDDVQFNLASVFTETYSSRSVDLIERYMDASFDGTTFYMVEVITAELFASIGNVAPEQTQTSRYAAQAFGFLRTVNISTGVLSSTAVDLGLFVATRTSVYSASSPQNPLFFTVVSNTETVDYTPGDYNGTEAMLTALAPDEPHHQLVAWYEEPAQIIPFLFDLTQPHDVFPYPLGVDYADGVTDALYDLLYLPIFDASRDEFYDFVPIHTAHQNLDRFAVGAVVPTITGTQYRLESLPIEPGQAWDTTEDNFRISPAPQPLWTSWPRIIGNMITINGFEGYMSGAQALPSSGGTNNAAAHYQWFSNRRYGAPYIIRR